VDPKEKSEDVAEASPCPRCGHPENPPENRSCGCGGASLGRLPVRSRELALRAKESKVALRERFLPGGLGPVGKTVAVSLVAVVADVGLAWLRYRLEKTDRQTLPHDVVRARPKVGAGDGPEYLHSFFLKEAALLLKEGEKTRRYYSSELEIKSNRIAR
jgi:hypothetical protein